MTLFHHQPLSLSSHPSILTQLAHIPSFIFFTNNPPKTTLVLLPSSLSRSLHLNHPSAQKHETETQENTHTNPPFTSSPLQHHTIPLPKNTKQNPLSLTSPSIISFTPQTNPSHTVTNKPEPHSSAKHSSLIFPNQPCLIIAHR